MPRRISPRKQPLSLALSGFYGRYFASLPIQLQHRVTKAFPSWWPWDMLDERQRKCLAKQDDGKNAIDLVSKEEARLAFPEGFKTASIPRRNKRNAKQPRPSRLKLRDADILKVKRDLEAEGIPPHKQRPEARRRICSRMSPDRISPEGFRKRWNRLMRKKAT